MDQTHFYNSMNMPCYKNDQQKTLKGNKKKYVTIASAEQCCVPLQLQGPGLE